MEQMDICYTCNHRQSSGLNAFKTTYLPVIDHSSLLSLNHPVQGTLQVTVGHVLTYTNNRFATLSPTDLTNNTKTLLIPYSLNSVTDYISSHRYLIASSNHQPFSALKVNYLLSGLLPCVMFTSRIDL
jgi:hypothetical protein